MRIKLKKPSISYYLYIRLDTKIEECQRKVDLINGMQGEEIEIVMKFIYPYQYIFIKTIQTSSPPRDIHFNLILPHGETLVAKVCQDNSKALMTTPNTALSNWLLRNILNLEEGELATRQKLDYLGFDSVKVTKFNDNTFYIDILSSHSYENFKIGNQSLSDT